MLLKSLLPRDPTGEFTQLLENLGHSTQPASYQGVWMSRDHQRALLILQTRVSGADTDGQEQAIQALRAAFEQTDACIRT